MSVGAIWLPGYGVVNLDVTRVQRALKNYDEKLEFGQHSLTGDWCIFVRLPRGADSYNFSTDGIPLFPVYGFRDRIPTPEEALDIVKRRDTFKNSDRILREINAHNEEINKQIASAADEASGEAAERIAHEIGKNTELNKGKIIKPVYVSKEVK